MAAKPTTKESRISEYERFALEYWTKWFKFKDQATDYYFRESMKNLKKAMKNARGNEWDEENFVSLREVKDIDEKIKRTLRENL